MFDDIVIGAGFSGATIARMLAENGKKVLIIEEKEIGGNAYDYFDGDNLIHKYGPHIFHTNDEDVYSFINKFCNLNGYEHRVKANVYGKYINVPFNITAIREIFSSKELEEKLISTYGDKVSIIELQNSDDISIREIAKYIYENIFLEYTKKQWGTTEIDPNVFNRVPVRLNEDDRYFQDKYQGLPEKGYTEFIKNILDHENINIKYMASETILSFGDKIYYIGNEFFGNIIYTGAIDRIFNWKLGKLPYRSLKFFFEKIDKEFYQDFGTINFTVDEDFTRITEFKHMTKVNSKDTIIVKEYSVNCDENNPNPYYPINNEENMNLYNKYKELNIYNNLYFLGRLAEYKYYNMDQAIKSALELGKKLI